MKLVSNTGHDRVVDLIRPWLRSGTQVDMATQTFSLFVFAELASSLRHVGRARLLLPPRETLTGLLGAEQDRAARNRLQTQWLARRCAAWLDAKDELRSASAALPQGAIVTPDSDSEPQQGVLGSFTFGTDGLGITPGNPLALIQASETADECRMLASWFEAQWHAIANRSDRDSFLVEALRELAEHRAPYHIYALILYHLFRETDEELDEERIVKSATGIRNTVVWNKLYRFQRDAVIGAIDKLNRFGGCIIADSIDLGKTFEALAVIKYHELCNDRVLVLCPKRLRDNWTLYKANDRRNILASDRFNYDVLNHTDLSRDGGLSGDIDLAHINWGNYDLLVIDESHNFRNKKTPKHGGEIRYDRLMRRIIQAGVKTRVLMLSATPVNNRLADLRNQIAFATEGDDEALLDQGIASIDGTTRRAQKQFNRWLDMDDNTRSRCCSRTWIGCAGARTSSKTATGSPPCMPRPPASTAAATPSSPRCARSSSGSAVSPSIRPTARCWSSPPSPIRRSICTRSSRHGRNSNWPSNRP
jgi:hypothetical protein